MSDIKYNEGLESIIKGINKTVDAVRSTFGPNGSTVFIKDRNRLINTKDGVTVARFINLEDPFENIGAMLVKEVAEKSNSEVGDGTTSSCILIQSLVNKIQESLVQYDKKYLLNQLNEIEKYLLEYLSKNKIDIDIENIRDVALIASNGDEEIANLLYSIFKNKGKNVDIRLEKIDEKGLSVEYSNGYTINRGYASPLFINNPSHEECYLREPDVIVYPKEVNSIRDIAEILEQYANPKSPVVFMCNYMNPQTIADISNNNMNNLLECLVVQTPINNNEDDMQDLLSVINAEKEDDYFIGSVDAVCARCQYTTFIKDNMNTKDRVQELNKRLQDKSISKYDKEKVKSRIYQLQGGSATIRIGANSNVEQKEIEDRVEDAVKACQAALKNGVVPGGGIFTARAASTYDANIKKNIFSSCFNDCYILLCNDAIQNEFGLSISIDYPGTEPTDEQKKQSYKIIKKEDGTYDFVYGNCLDLGIIDPADVVENSIKNSVSVARSVLTNKVSINND